MSKKICLLYENDYLSFYSSKNNIDFFVPINLRIDKFINKFIKKIINIFPECLSITKLLFPEYGIKHSNKNMFNGKRIRFLIYDFKDFSIVYYCRKEYSFFQKKSVQNYIMILGNQTQRKQYEEFTYNEETFPKIEFNWFHYPILQYCSGYFNYIFYNQNIKKYPYIYIKEYLEFTIRSNGIHQHDLLDLKSKVNCSNSIIKFFQEFNNDNAIEIFKANLCYWKRNEVMFYSILSDIYKSNNCVNELKEFIGKIMGQYTNIKQITKEIHLFKKIMLIELASIENYKHQRSLLESYFIKSNEKSLLKFLLSYSIKIINEPFEITGIELKIGYIVNGCFSVYARINSEFKDRYKCFLINQRFLSTIINFIHDIYIKKFLEYNIKITYDNYFIVSKYSDIINFNPDNQLIIPEKYSKLFNNEKQITRGKLSETFLILLENHTKNYIDSLLQSK